MQTESTISYRHQTEKSAESAIKKDKKSKQTKQEKCWSQRRKRRFPRKSGAGVITL